MRGSAAGRGARVLVARPGPPPLTTGGYDVPAKRYDWDVLLRPRRRARTLLRGRDYDCSTIAFSQQLRQAASARRIGLSVVEVEGGISVMVFRRVRPAREGVR